MHPEGHDIARWLNSLGVAGIVLHIRLGPRYHHPAQLHDAQRAMRFTRAHAKEWGIDPAKVGIMGFSAGGHLASMAGTHFDSGNPDAVDPIDRLQLPARFHDSLLSGDSHDRPLRPRRFAQQPARPDRRRADPKLAESLSNDTQVTAETPPTFLVHTSEDTVVPPENSVLFYQALTKHNVPAELHIYEKGRHGMGMGPADLPYFELAAMLCRLDERARVLRAATE